VKKQVTILTFLFFHCFCLWSQQFVKIATPCSEEFLQNVRGRWLDFGAGLNANISKNQQQEIVNRLDKIHQFVFNSYPSPVGVDAGQERHTTDEQFAYQVKLDHLANGNTTESWINGVPVVLYWYVAVFGKYSCGRDKYEMLRGLPSEDHETFCVYANSLNFVTDGPYEMNIDGRKIKMMPVVKGKWKGYTLYTPEPGSGKTMVLLHRDGMFPYIPVTRKQYLDLSISYLNQMFDTMIADIDKNAKMFTAAGMADLQTLKEKKEGYQKTKREVLKYYKDELTATTAAGLLDSSAIINGYSAMCDVSTTYPIFATEATGGRLLVIANPTYIRKDLPKYIPQFFALSFEETAWTPRQKNDPLKAVQESFPIEKLQAMIDK